VLVLKLVSSKIKILKSFIVNKWNLLKSKFAKQKQSEEPSPTIKRILEIVDYIENRNGMRSTMLNQSSKSE